MSNIFTSVSIKKPRFNTFDLSHDRKFNMGTGRLVPCFLMETVPNDRVSIQTSQLIRAAPLVYPTMHRFEAYVHFFFVPNRILWKSWEKFINGGESGTDAPVFPFIQFSGIGANSLPDYLGLPLWTVTVGESATRPVSAVPFAGYQKIWYEFYRDQNNDTFTAPYLESDGDGIPDGNVLLDADVVGITILRERSWQHDYFTSALPFTQRGPEATIPLGTTADLSFVNPSIATAVQRANGAAFPAVYNDIETNIGGTTREALVADVGGGVRSSIVVDNSANLEVDLSSATAATINDLRRAFRLQEWLELNARAGSRYNEAIMAHFGISPGDARLQRPEFLGGSSTPIVFSEVLQTSATSTEPSPLATLGGHAISVGGRHITRYKCREHGYIFGLMSIRPKSAYQQGIPKHFLKFDKFDYFWKSFANIGEQAILNKELYIDNISDPTTENDTFGYTPRYAEYKYLNDTVHGSFKTSLDFTHAGRIFSSLPTLSAQFVYCQPEDVSRIFAVTGLTDEQWYVQMHHKVKATRPMPYFGTPTM